MQSIAIKSIIWSKTRRNIFIDVLTIMISTDIMLNEMGFILLRHDGELDLPDGRPKSNHEEGSAMRKWIAMLLSLALLLSVTGLAAAAGGTTITVACWDLVKTPYYASTKAAFEAANPGVTVEYIDLASQDYNVKLGTMLAGGDTTDVLYIKELSD